MKEMAETPTGTRVGTQRGAVLIGLAGGMLVVSGGLAASYYVVATRSEARAATITPAPSNEKPASVSKDISPALRAFTARSVDVKTVGGVAKLTWGELGIEVDPSEIGRAGSAVSESDLASLAKQGSIPVKLDRDKAVKALIALKARYDKSPTDAFLDLEERVIQPDNPGAGIDVWGSLPRIETFARQGAASFELAGVPVPASVTKETLGIDDVSQVMGHYVTKFPVTERDRNFNLKLAASKINGTVLKPHDEWSFNGNVGERSEKEGYKIAHVITAGEMVDGLAGGTCQISTTLFGAAFFAGLEIPKTTNHSRPSVYTPLGFDATVVWPDTDLVLKNPYEFPVVLHYRVANGEAVVEILGKKRPWDRVEFAREIEEETPYPTEERLDEEMPEGQTMLDQAGFNGYKMKRYRRFYTGKKMVKEQKWTVNYKPVTEYIRRGTNKDPSAVMPPVKEVHGPKVPSSEKFTMSQ
ncbi:MAG: VanW family protein [Myxococcales bacterium]|nr:VanW family protein [Myxococcales bacterium]